jgi:hypothetical protein
VTAASVFAATAPGRVVARLGAFHFRAGGQAVSAARGLAGEPGPADPTSPGGNVFSRMACVYLDAPTPELKEAACRLVLAAQNGSATYSRSAPSCYLGDTAVRISLRPLAGDAGTLLLDVSARLDPAHLTQAFIYQGPVARADARPFWDMFQASRDFVLTVAEAGRLDLARVYIVKYHIEGGL